MIVLALAACVEPPVAASPETRNGGSLGATGSAGGDRAAAPLLNPAWIVIGANNSYFGYALDKADTNGDALSDLLAGSPAAQSYRGRADVFFGDPAGPAATPSWTELGAGGGLHGLSVASCDVDGDGYDEVAIGEPEAEQVHVFSGSATGPGSQDVIPDPDAEPGGGGGDSGWWGGSYHLFGWSVACGDVNADGHPDLLVGAPEGGVTDGGMAYVFPGSADGLSTTPMFRAEGVRYSGFGMSVAWLGDVNGDGLGDLAVGTDAYSPGHAAVFHGAPGAPDAAADWTLDLAPPAIWGGGGGTGTTGGTVTVTVTGTGTTTTTTTTWGDTGGWGGGDSGWTPGPPEVGETVAHAGDVNADGYADLLLGGWDHDDDEGIALLYLGSPAGLEAVSAWRVDATDEILLGYNLAGLPDLDGDGFPEIGVTAPFATQGGGYAEGAGYVFRGTADGAETTAAFTLYGGANAAVLWDVADLGDMDGDGYAEVGFSLIYQDTVRILTAAAPSGTPGDTGTTPSDTGTPPTPNTTDTTTDTTTDAPATDGGGGGTKDEEDGGCGCRSNGAAGALALLPLLALVRARRGRRLI